MIRTRYDRDLDVLYVLDEREHVAHSHEHQIDSDLVLNYNRDGQIVGAQFLFVRELRGMWGAHPGRHCLPGAIRDSVDRFMAWLEAGPADPELCAQRTVPPEWLLASYATGLQQGQYPENTSRP